MVSIGVYCSSQNGAIFGEKAPIEQELDRCFYVLTRALDRRRAGFALEMAQKIDQIGSENPELSHKIENWFLEVYSSSTNAMPG
ncbi:hypothetical protein COB21_02015 [Candidatus Aerophobetes bacterium]|uniref:Uncharacterized protein n=1 Tax=Aerophobetes bacterium TaxID=2030807 RepID=A0A2A4X5Q3_UNCAE|nr:MAG: hypothetical protein COB21_02015 [Candidatus Aerophobetes bacterium]